MTPGFHLLETRGAILIAGATTESGEPAGSGFSRRGATRWWTWTAPSGGSTRIDTIGSSFNTVLAVFTGGAVTGLTGVATNDNAAAPVNIAVARAIVTRGSVGKHLDNGSDQGTNWPAPDFNDSAWASGPARLGDGDTPTGRPSPAASCKPAPALSLSSLRRPCRRSGASGRTSNDPGRLTAGHPMRPGRVAGCTSGPS